MTVKIHTIIGQRPPGWDRQVIFFANLLSLFYGNQSETEILRREVGSLETYGSRLVPLINLIFRRSDNLLILEQEPDEALVRYFQKELELSLPEIKILPHQDYCALTEGKKVQGKKTQSLIPTLQNHSAPWIDGYVTDDLLRQTARNIGKNTITSVEGSRQGNNKLSLYTYLKAQGLPLFDTVVVSDAGEVRYALQELKAKGFTRAVIKASVGASGIGMQRISLTESRWQKPSFAIPEYLFFEGPVLVQGWIDENLEDVRSVGSPSVQLFLDDESASLYDITEQILSKESVHEGNVVPPPYLSKYPQLEEELLCQAKAAAAWLFEQGYRGTASVDFLIVERQGRLEVRVCEVNARVTGATYPSIIARTFMPNGAWLMRNIRFQPPVQSRAILNVLRNDGLLYLPGQAAGVLPINFNPNRSGGVMKGQFLFLAKSSPETFSLLKRMSELKSIQGVYDRD